MKTMPSSIVHPSWARAHRRELAVAVATAGFACVAFLAPPASVTTYIPLPLPTVVQQPPTMVQTYVPLPLPILVPSASHDEPTDGPIRTRAIVPMLDATCVAPLVGREGDGVSRCAWPDGIPAISADGTTIATWLHAGEPTIAMGFIDAKTSRVIREERLVADPHTLDEDTLVPYARRADVLARTAALETELRTSGYRPMIAPVIGHIDDPPRRGVRIEYATYEEAIRLVEGDVQLWRGDFDVHEVFPRPPAQDEPCAPIDIDVLRAWWDATTRTVLVEASYRGPQESCPATYHYFVRHAPRP